MSTSRDLRAASFILLATFALALPYTLLAQVPNVDVVITADNAYRFGFGTQNAIPASSIFGGVENTTAGQIFNCPIGNGPEAYTVSGASLSDYLYIVGWSDASVTQGVLGQFRVGTNPPLYTGQGAWEVYATGMYFPIGSGGPPLATINAQIGIANAGTGGVGTTSIGWVGTVPTAGREGVLVFGENNSTGSGGTCANPFPIVCATAMDAAARWMWYDRPGSSCAFTDGNQREFLIFRIPLHEVPGTCGTCDGTTVTVTQDVTVDFSPITPTCSGDPGLCNGSTFSSTKVGPPDNWRAIFNLGGKELIVAKGVTITTIPYPAAGNNRAAPGIDIRGTCRLQVDAGDATTAAGAIVVSSLNQAAGPININFDGGVTINGTVLDEVRGTNGTPGDINIDTFCGNIVTGPMSHIVTIGQDHGGSDISLTSCKGDIVINGLVDASYKAAPASTINVDAPAGAVTINGNTLIEIEPGTGRRVTSGISVRSRRDPVAGFINIQAGNDVTVFGNKILTANPAWQNYGAVAIKPGGTNGTSGSGAMTVVSLNARIVASDRAFDFANRFNLLNSITLFAKGDINLSVTPTGPQAVVSTQGGSAGQGGTNTLRSYSGGINIATGAQVLADFTGTPGVNGSNLLTSCTGVIPPVPPGVKPPDAFPLDDSGTCAPPAPNPILTLCVPQGSCQPSGSLSVLINGTNVISYVPMGNWLSTLPNVAVVNVEGSSIVPQEISTSSAINSCASSSVTLPTICTANNGDVYKISGTAILLPGSLGSGSITFSGGSCTSCGVAMDAANNQAVIAQSTGVPQVGGYQFLNLSLPALVPTLFASPAPLPPFSLANISEDILIDPIRKLILSPNEGGNFEIVDVANTASPVFFENAVSGSPFFDSAGEDCSTGLALAPVEFSGPSQVHAFNLTNVAYVPGSPAGTWSAPSTVLNLLGSFLPAGASGIAVAQGTNTAILTGEFGGDAITAIKLPATLGSGPPLMTDFSWVTCSIPFVPALATVPPTPPHAFYTGLDPHTVTAYKDPITGHAMALVANFDFVVPPPARPTFLAKIDFTSMLVSVPATGNVCNSGTLPSSVVSFIAIPYP